MSIGNWGVCVCVCVLLPLRLIRQGPSAIVMKVLVIKAQGAFKRAGRQSAYDVRCVQRAGPGRRLLDQGGVPTLEKIDGVLIGCSLYRGLSIY